MDFRNWKRLINSSDVSDRVEAADDIPRDHATEVASLLLERLKDEDQLVRTCAVDSLRSFKKNEPVRVAVARFFDTEGDLLAKAYAISTLAEISDISQYDEVLRRWNRSENSKVRLHAATGIVKGIYSDALAVLIGFSSSRDEETRIGAINALKEVLEVLRSSKVQIMSVMRGNRGAALAKGRRKRSRHQP